MENWGHAKKEWLESFVELPNGIVSHDIFNRVFSMIKPEQFHKVFIEWVEAVTEKIEEIVAIDGKTVRRSIDGSSGKRAIHVVSAWSVENGIVLGQCRTEEKSNEITAIPELLKQLELRGWGCIVTIDAMGTQTKIAETIIRGKANYILQVKENQPRLYEDISLYFKEEAESAGKKTMTEKGCYYKEYSGKHGRIEEREYYVAHDIE